MDRGHDIGTIDLSANSETDVALIAILLRSDEIPFELDNGLLLFASDRNEDVHRHVASVLDRFPSADTDAGIEASSETSRLTPTGALRATFGTDDGSIAPRWRRLVGWFVDSTIISISAALVVVANDLAALAVLIDACYYIVATALWGRTIGKKIMRTRVVERDRRDLPSWSASALRWSAFGWVMLLGLALPDLAAYLAFPVFVVVYLPILWDADRRGLHDRLAGTVVVETQSARTALTDHA